MIDAEERPEAPFFDEEAAEERKEGVEERLLETRAILLSEPVSKESSQDIVSKLLLLDYEDPKAPIDLYINSPGGEVDAGFAIFDMVRSFPAVPGALVSDLSPGVLPNATGCHPRQAGRPEAERNE